MAFSPETYALLKGIAIDAQAYAGDASDSADAAAYSAEQAAASAATSAANTGLAPQFDATEDYSEGQFVLYSGVVYIFTADHAAGAWTGTDAEQTTIGEGVYTVIYGAMEASY